MSARLLIFESVFKFLIGTQHRDMQDQIGMDQVVRDRLGWTRVTTARTQARKDFDQLAAEWKIHQQLSQQKPTSSVNSTMSTPQLDSVSFTDESDGHERCDNAAAPEPRPVQSNGKKHADTNGNKDDQSNVPLSSLKPWQRISRKMFVAVGWKAGGCDRGGK